MATHIVQSPAWGEFKESYGTPVIKVGNIQYTKHKIPFSSHYYAYCPRVNPFEIDFKKLKKSAKDNNVVNVNFDVPNVVKGTPEGNEATHLFKEHCVKAPRDQFAKGNVLIDLSRTDREIFKGMHHKHRYNIKYAKRKGVTVKLAKNQDDFEIFYRLYKETAERQKYFFRSRSYCRKIWRILGDKDLCTILIAEFRGEPLASWMLLRYDHVLYYPYGGSSLKHRNLHGSTMLAWEAIQIGKHQECHTFDMWGTAVDADNKRDPYFGFTNYKLKFGGTHVVYVDSYDFVINPTIYNMFNTANNFRWLMLNLLK